MPWAIFNRPSIQLGALKAYVEQVTNTRVTTLHPYLHIARVIGTDSYATIADNSWAGEAIFSALLFPERFEKAHQLFTQSLGKKATGLPAFETLVNAVEETCNTWVEHVNWSDYSLTGFSLCFNQLLASLYISSRVKTFQNVPPIVFGGSSCGDSLGQSLLDHFPQVDYIIDGEGETPLASLCDFIADQTKPFPDRVLARIDFDNRIASPEIPDLNSLPVPDYGPYFQQLKSVFPDSPFIPTLPLEFSRGCWWNKCTFCNLNLQWCGYRHKKANKVSQELKQLAANHQCLDFTFTDNALPPAEADIFFKKVSEGQADYRFFAEIRGIGKFHKLHAYKQGGLDTIQVGIESLSNSLLKKMKKGVDVIDNIAIMKFSAAAGISLEGNLIVEFPGSTDKEIEETLSNLEYVLPYNPLAPAAFFLGHGSPVEKQPADYSISAITHHRKNRALFPTSYMKTLKLLIRDYRGDRQEQRKRWQPVRKRIAQWQQFHANRNSVTSSPLNYRDGDTFLLIRQEIAGAAPLRHRLQGLSREIYLFCEEIRTISELTEAFSSLKESAILAFIHQLCQKRLMYRENGRVISLAIRCN